MKKGEEDLYKHFPKEDREITNRDLKTYST